MVFCSSIAPTQLGLDPVYEYLHSKGIEITILLSKPTIMRQPLIDYLNGRIAVVKVTKTTRK